MELGITRILKAGESGLGFVKSMDMPLGIAKTVCGIGSAFSYTSDLSQKVQKRVNLALGPPDFAALALDTLELARSLNVPEIPIAKVSELALSILKKSCDILGWLQNYSLITLESSVLWRLEGVAILSGLTKDSLRLWQELGPNPPSDRDLMIIIPKVLKSSLSLYAYVADDKRVKIVTAGLGLMGDGYSFYKRCASMNPRTWTVKREHVYQIISSIALAGLAYYAFEKGFLPESIR